MDNVIKYTKAKYPSFVSYNERLRTYIDGEWPIGLAQRPEPMAEAGFCYLGHGDRVQCFYCGEIIHQWLPKDTPWKEHAKWNSNCTFLNLIKSPEYVRKVNGCFQVSSTNNNDPVKNEYVRDANEGIEMRIPQTKLQILKYNLFTSRKCKLLTRKSTQLSEENLKLKQERLCKICFDREATFVLIPCGHFVSCNLCSSSLSNCPICRSNIKEFVKTYR